MTKYYYRLYVEAIYTIIYHDKTYKNTLSISNKRKYRSQTYEWGGGGLNGKFSDDQNPNTIKANDNNAL